MRRVNQLTLEKRWQIYCYIFDLRRTVIAMTTLPVNTTNKIINQQASATWGSLGFESANKNWNKIKEHVNKKRNERKPTEKKSATHFIKRLRIFPYGNPLFFLAELLHFFSTGNFIFHRHSYCIGIDRSINDEFTLFSHFFPVLCVREATCKLKNVAIAIGLKILPFLLKWFFHIFVIYYSLLHWNGSLPTNIRSVGCKN